MSQSDEKQLHHSQVYLICNNKSTIIKHSRNFPVAACFNTSLLYLQMADTTRGGNNPQECDGVPYQREHSGQSNSFPDHEAFKKVP